MRSVVDFKHGMLVGVLRLAFLTEVVLVANDAFVSDSDYWIFSTDVAFSMVDFVVFVIFIKLNLILFDYHFLFIAFILFLNFTFHNLFIRILTLIKLTFFIFHFHKTRIISLQTQRRFLLFFFIYRWKQNLFIFFPF